MITTIEKHICPYHSRDYLLGSPIPDKEHWRNIDGMSKFSCPTFRSNHMQNGKAMFSQCCFPGITDPRTKSPLCHLPQVTYQNRKQASWMNGDEYTKNLMFNGTALTGRRSLLIYVWWISSDEEGLHPEAGWIWPRQGGLLEHHAIVQPSSQVNITVP